MKNEKQDVLGKLPIEAAEYIRLVVKYIRYRKRVRADVQAELAGHFEDAIRDCKDDEQRRAAVKKIIEEFGDAKMLAVLTRRAKKRCRPWWKKAIIKSFQTAGVIILLFILYVGWFLSGKPRIDTDYLAKYNEMARPTADESLNAAPYYEKAAGLLVEDQSGDCNSKSKNKYDFIRKDFNEANDADIEKIAKWLADNNDVFGLIEQGTQKPYFWRTYTGDPNQPGRLLAMLLPNLAKYRSICYGLDWRAYIKAGSGNYAGAFDDIKTSYMLGRHNKGNKTIIENLVGISIEVKSVYTLRAVLKDFEVPKEYLTNWQNQFEETIQGEDFSPQGFSGEKMMMYDEIQRCFIESWIGPDHISIQGIVLLERYSGGKDVDIADMWFEYAKRGFVGLLFINQPDKQQTYKQADDFYNLWEGIAKKTPAQIKKEKIDIDKKANEYAMKNIMLKLLAPAFEKVIEIHYRAKADIESVVPMIAVLRYKADKGVCPENLQQLVDEGYLKQIPIDPFSDEPMRYKKAGDDFVLYSVGLNLVDDGGVMGKDLSGKSKNWLDNGDAIFWPVGK